ncbi:MAG: GPR endopeptidase [Oscillospiraceae bacterium]|jgi:spore protease|nr:GPR endopeptidase [Oscillospiraceae bacterium]MDY4192024.1 GPR endopeptidase [Oscillospiraceae bacterium]
MNFRTDLAVELAEIHKKELSEGLETSSRQEGTVRVERTRITTAGAERIMGKPRGTYITIEAAPFSSSVTSADEEAEILAGEIAFLLGGRDGLILAAGLGNADITPDALGPLAVGRILATRHMTGKTAEAAGLSHLRPVAAVAPGVLGQTGIETSEIIASLCEKIKPSAAIIIDALAARSLSRLGNTIQLADTGISPGSGVQNRRRELSRDTLGVPVLSIGVPTVVDGHTLGCDLLGEWGYAREAKRHMAPEGRQMMVTPRDIDQLIKRASEVVAMGINRALQPELSAEEIHFLVS